jgi:hypothetical protein
MLGKDVTAGLGSLDKALLEDWVGNFTEVVQCTRSGRSRRCGRCGCRL